ncbi:MAG: heparan-alpha-glucosaminide N-acetyltransferase domain-containing protein [Ornithinimicrobium sp.]
MTDVQTHADPAAPAPEDSPETAIVHACDPESVSAAPLEARDSARTSRLIGIDVARGLALMGMMVIHILPAADARGNITTAWSLAAGTSAALFAVVAGVGIALSTGRREHLVGRRWVAAAASLVVRALLIGTLGLLLGRVVSGESAAVILPYYALLFIGAIPLLRVPARWLAVLTLVLAFATPALSHLWRETTVLPETYNPTFDNLLSEPGSVLASLLLTGEYPAMAWITYICAGLAIGRCNLFSRGVVGALLMLGIGLAVAARGASWLLLEHAGGREALEAAAPGSMTSTELSDVLVFGADGVLPTTSPWWLAVSAPHTTTPFDLLFTIGVACAVLCTMILLGRAIGYVLWPIAAAGSMTLTLYTAHLLLLDVSFMPDSATAMYAVHLVGLLLFAMLWRRDFARGPLEEVVRALSGSTGRWVAKHAPAVRQRSRSADAS